MSIKTLRKRIALVAVSALGVGLLSVAPASATLDSDSITIDSAKSTGVCVEDSGAGAAKLTSVAISKTGTLVLDVGANSDTPASGDTIKLTGSAYFSDSKTGGSSSKSTISADQKKVTTTAAAYEVDISFTAAGTVTVYNQTAGAGAALHTITVTVVDSCAGTTTPSAANSYVQVVATSGYYQTAANAGTTTETALTSISGRGYGELLASNNDSVITFDNGSSAYVNIAARNGFKGYLVGTSYTYQLSCTGDVVVNDGNSNSGFVAGIASAYTIQFDVDQGTMNNPVTTICTASVNGVAVGSKTIKFLGDLAKIEALTYYRGESNTTTSSTTAGQIRYRFFDSAGSRLDYDQTGVGTVALTTTNSPLVNAISVTTSTTQTASGYVKHNCVGATSSGEVKVTLKATNAAGATITSNEVVASCSRDIYTYTASLDKAVYQKGDVAILTITAKDISGALVHDFDTIGDTTYESTITVNGMTAVATPTDVDTFTDGVKKYTYAVGTTAGSYVASVSLPINGSAQDAVTIKYTIAAEAGVSNAEVLAAIVKLIASINKQIRALQKSLKR